MLTNQRHFRATRMKSKNITIHYVLWTFFVLFLLRIMDAYFHPETGLGFLMGRLHMSLSQPFWVDSVPFVRRIGPFCCAVC